MRTRSLVARRPVVAILAVMALCVALMASLGQAWADTNLATFTGTVDTTGGTAVLLVEVPSAPDADGVPAQLTDIPVSQSTVDSGGHFTLGLPDTTTVHNAAENGWVNTVTVVADGNQFTSNHSSVLIDSGNDAAGSSDETDVAGGTVDEGQVPAMANMGSNVETGLSSVVSRPDDNTHCIWTRLSTTELPNRVGELHVADVSGASGTFQYHTQADSHFEVGLSVNGGNYGADGTATVSNSIGTSAQYTQGSGHTSYANDDMFWAKYANNGATSCPGSRRKVQATSSSGDVFTGVNTPGVAPWGTCHSDSHGYVIVNANGSWGVDRATAHQYGEVSNAFGFTAGGHTGYTSGIHVIVSTKGTRTYVCGDHTPPDMSVVYNKKY